LLTARILLQSDHLTADGVGIRTKPPRGAPLRVLYEREQILRQAHGRRSVGIGKIGHSDDEENVGIFQVFHIVLDDGLHGDLRHLVVGQRNQIGRCPAETVFQVANG
jgi:hypothetical protein